PTHRIRQVIAGSGHQAEDSLIQMFGLKDADRVDALEIRWPSGLTQTLHDIAANQAITVFEGRATFQQGLIFEGPAAKKEKVVSTFSARRAMAQRLSRTWSSFLTRAQRGRPPALITHVVIRIAGR